MNKSKLQITPFQLAFLIIQTQIGVGVLSLPYSVQTLAKGDGWISALIAGFAVNFFIWIMILLCRKFPQKNLFEFAPAILGKLGGKVITLAYTLYFLAISSLIILLYSNIIFNWIFSKTPKWAILLLMVAVCVYLAKEPLRFIARFHVFASILIVVLVVLVSYAYINIDIRYIFPVGQYGLVRILKGSKEAIFSLLGFEMILIVYPYVLHRRKSALKAMVFANLSVTLLYTFIVFTCLIVFSPVEITLVPEPVLYMLKAFSSRLVDRIDLLLLSIWVVIVSTSYISYLYMAGRGVKNLLGSKNSRFPTYLAAFLSYWPPLFIQGQAQLNTIGKTMNLISFIFIIGLPLLLLLLAILFNKKDIGEAET